MQSKMIIIVATDTIITILFPPIEENSSKWKGKIQFCTSVLCKHRKRFIWNSLHFAIRQLNHQLLLIPLFEYLCVKLKWLNFILSKGWKMENKPIVVMNEPRTRKQKVTSHGNWILVKFQTINQLFSIDLMSKKPQTKYNLKGIL